MEPYTIPVALMIIGALAILASCVMWISMFTNTMEFSKTNMIAAGACIVGGVLSFYMGWKWSDHVTEQNRLRIVENNVKSQ